MALSEMNFIEGNRSDIRNLVYKSWTNHSSAETVNLGFQPKKVIFQFIYGSSGTTYYARIYDADYSTTQVRTYLSGEDKGLTDISNAEFSITSTGITISNTVMRFLNIYILG